jgi:outer membrane protein assembly factor BamB
MSLFARSFSTLTLALASALAPAHADVQLIAVGRLPAFGKDLSGLTGKLENGVRANLLGGIGSGLAWAGGTTFLALPDRGPNASDWNADLDNTTSWIPRFHTLTLALTPATTGKLPYTLTPTLTGTTLLWSPSALNYGPAVPVRNTATRFYFSGRSDNFAAGTASLNGKNARLDPEGIRVSRDGTKVYISDEYGPYVYAFDRATGQRTRVFKLPDALSAATLSAMGDVEIEGNTSGRVANKGMEGLAITPDGQTLVGFMQSALLQDGGDGARVNRIVTINVATGAVKQYAYDNHLADKDKTYGSSEILALNAHEMLVLERDGKGLGDDSAASVKRIYKVDLSDAEDVSALSGESALLAKAPTKTLFLDVVSALQAAGYKDTQIPAKLEGMAFGADITIDGRVHHTLYLSNDNDFLATSPDGKANPNQIFVFAFRNSDLGGSVFRNQRFAQ